MKIRLPLLLLGLAACLPTLATTPPPPQAVRVYVGTYTDTDSKGIYRLRLDLGTGGLSAEGEAAAAKQPSWLVLSPDGSHLYAVVETGDGPKDPPGGVSAYRVDKKTGALTFLNTQPSGGPAPCHLSMDAAGRYVFVANYWGGNISAFPVTADGSLGPATAFVQHETLPGAEEGPHAHSIDLDAANRFAIVDDLGLDRVFTYAFDKAKGTLTKTSALELPKGAGPRHFAFHPDGRRGYVIDELDSTITAVDYDAATGALKATQSVSTLPADYKGKNGTAEIVVSPDGRFLYGSNRGHDSLAIFAIDAATGKLSLVGHQPTLGKHPRHFAIDPTGSYLLVANRDSDNVVVFRIDRKTGRLTAVGEPYRVPHAVCVLMTRIVSP